MGFVSRGMLRICNISPIGTTAFFLFLAVEAATWATSASRRPAILSVALETRVRHEREAAN